MIQIILKITMHSKIFTEIRVLKWKNILSGEHQCPHTTSNPGQKKKKKVLLYNQRLREDPFTNIWPGNTVTPRNRSAYCILTIGSSYLNNAHAAHAYLVDDWLLSSSDFACPLCGIKYTLLHKARPWQVRQSRPLLKVFHSVCFLTSLMAGGIHKGFH